LRKKKKKKKKKKKEMLSGHTATLPAEYRAYSNPRGEVYHVCNIGAFVVGAEDAHSTPFRARGEAPVVENLDYVSIAGGRTYPPHIHDDSAAVIYITRGSGMLLLGDKRIPYAAGARYFLASGVAHGFETAEDTEFLSVQSPSIVRTDGSVDLHYP
jgi:quercetin dioxygenase-like cupin family protein